LYYYIIYDYITFIIRGGGGGGGSSSPGNSADNKLFKPYRRLRTQLYLEPILITGKMKLGIHRQMFQTKLIDVNNTAALQGMQCALRRRKVIKF
jgi:hypothetical protein